MNLAEAIDFLAGNCPTVFAPIATELDTLRTEKESLEVRVTTMQSAIDFMLMNGGI